MEINIKYTLPEEKYEYECSINSRKYLHFLQEIDNFLRYRERYKDSRYASTLRDVFYKYMEENDITLNVGE